MKWFKGFLVVVLCFTLIAVIGTEALKAQDSELTKEQLQDIENAKIRTERLLKNWNKVALPDEKELKKEFKYKYLKKGVNSGVTVTAPAGSIGSYGDILVTLSESSSGSSSWVGGHAGVVYNSDYTVESFGNKGSLNGVRRWPNDWGVRYSNVKGLWVSGAGDADYRYAADYSYAQIGKPYNYNFFDINRTDAFYCSQLAWRAWKNRGWDLNDGGAVWPVDLVESPHTVVFYSK
ncbi:cell wall-associated hydrolase-like protein [Thermosediminibacter oceani]|uniref:Cell wall-associated hydrolase-like protein n=1 Tax=Thermosediminibacter oceani (strain ATCC BAA-1034 / DSM 16646 / JW/IW-1228P) TaxID=555079 RepID=D9RYT6_THEOJ|nr:cell wall-associated hydrolase-like protein [Thermosediminibacter oceani]ADL08510.1 cell wall-associated hydrolase-like protein [Thermosediminibacter oceani DSM 16646]